MFRFILHISFVLFFTQNYFCQVRTIKPIKTHSRQTNLAIGGGLTKSALFLARNVKQNNDAIGYNGSVIYGKKLFRGSLEYTYYRKIDIQPNSSRICASLPT